MLCVVGVPGTSVCCVPSLQDCIICMEKLSVTSGYSDVTASRSLGPMGVGRLTKCSHTFHLLCLLAMYCNGNKVPQPLGDCADLLPLGVLSHTWDLSTQEAEAVGAYVLAQPELYRDPVSRKQNQKVA